MQKSVRITCMVFMIFIGASVFSLVFRGFGGDHAVHDLLMHLPGGTFSAVLIVMVLMFLLGFILDFIEITFVVVPIVGPVLLSLGIDPVWLGIMIAINLQTSFLTPPFGFALFYLRGVAPAEIRTRQIYRGVATVYCPAGPDSGPAGQFPGPRYLAASQNLLSPCPVQAGCTHGALTRREGSRRKRITRTERR